MTNPVCGGVGTETKSVIQVENVVGSNYSDTITGTSGPNTLNGLDGNDVIDGLAGNDWLGGGSDNDVLIPRSGNDTIKGGDGVDRVEVQTTFGVTLRLDLGSITGGGFSMTISEVENATGSIYADIIYGTNDANVLLGLSGNDSIYALDGNDTVRGGNGADTIEGGDGADSLYGDTQDDVLYAYDSAIPNFADGDVDLLDGGDKDIGDTGYGSLADGDSTISIEFAFIV
jgi:Ca2+-binding RTX toxin-like protein